jgi:NAD(P)-dependent dehydrogenase (short-subunit alcohol dehydrogenase family)
VAAIRDAGGRGAAFAADATDPRAVADLVDAVERELGPVDVLVPLGAWSTSRRWSRCGARARR